MKISQMEHKLEWTVSEEDELQMWFGTDPRTASESNGDFRTYLLHELGHWIVAQEQEPSIGVEGLGLYGIVHDADGGLRIVGAGGGVQYSSCIAGDWELAVANAAGVVIEKLAENDAFVFDDPLGLLDADVTFDNDRANIVKHLKGIGITEKSPDFLPALRQAMNTAADIIRPCLPRIRDQVLCIERIVVERRLTKLEIKGSGVHASLLSGRPAHDYEL